MVRGRGPRVLVKSRSSLCAAIFGAFLVFALSFGLLACSTSTARAPADAQFVHAYSSGVVSARGSIRVEFVSALKGMVDDSRFLPSALSFEPPIKGSTRWVDDNSIEFTPESVLPRDRAYTAHFSAAQLRPYLSQARDFDFQFRVSGQSLDVSTDALTVPSSARTAGADVSAMQLSGIILTQDSENAQALEKTLNAEESGVHLSVSWTHDSEGRTHRFVIDGIRRGDSDRLLNLSWDGGSLSAKQKGSRQFTVPSLNSFSLLAYRPIQDQDQYIDVAFSDPLDPNQDLRGLISFTDAAGHPAALKYAVDGSRVKVYNANKWPKSGTMRFDSGIRSASNKHLVATTGGTVAFASQKPQVRFSGAGVILPTSQGLTIPIETMNLKYVMVEATRVFQENIPQFLQVNDLKGTKELNRVGKVVWRQVVDLGWKPQNQDTWVRYGLDVSKLLAKNPDGLFRIKLTFRMQHVVFSGVSSDQSATDVTWDAQAIPNSSDEDSNWDDYSSDEEDLDYDQRENPADLSYYHDWYDHHIDANRNVMISDIGLMAKRGTDGSLLVVANDLKTTNPLVGLDVSVLDYTKQSLAKGSTDAQGMLNFRSFTDTPYFVVARQGNQYGYLKLGDGDALSVSQFDVAGERNEGGIKGFIYGERGVWRPGDTMYLNFILWDPNRVLPPEHPVSLELYSPQGELFDTWTQNDAKNGFYHFEPATSENSPTGNWTARVHVGGLSFEKSLKVETVMPNRLKIDLGLVDSPNGITNGTVKAHLAAQWLTGIKAPGLRAQVKVDLSPIQTTFPNHPELKGFVFDDPSRVFQSSPATIFDDNLDQNGEADIVSDMDVESYAPGKLRANFDTRVYEPGGAFSSDVFSADYQPYSRYVGIRAPAGDVARGMLMTDTDHTLNIVVVDPSGNPVPGKVQVKAEIFQIGWRWWWEGGEDSEALAEYISDRSLKPLNSQNLTVTNGSADWKFRVAYPLWGRFLIRVTDSSGQHSTGVIKYIDWPGWAGRNQKDGPGGASVLLLSTDKTTYNVGDTVTVSIPGNASGRALISFEKSGKIYKEEWLKPSSATTTYSFTATQDMAPNIYVHVTFLQPHLQTANDVPIRTYGIVPVLVQNPDSHLQPVIDSDDVFKPASNVKVRVHEANGRPMTYTLALVDEGLLTLTRYTAPDPWDSFYKREASLSKSWDLYDFVAGAYAGTLENMLSIGGGDEGDQAGQRKANRFPPVVRFIAPTELAAGATNEHTITLPQYVGAVRLMVVAASQSPDSKSAPAYGRAEKSVQVKQEVMLLGTLPRVLAPSEEAEVPVSVFYTGTGKIDVPLSIKVGGAMTLITPASQKVHFNEAGEQIVSFRVRGGDRVGSAFVHLEASGAKDKAVQDVNLDVRLPANKISTELRPGASGDTSATVLAAGQTWQSQNTPLPGYAGTNTAAIEFSIMPPIDLSRRIDYLIQYPYGCIEQTVSSVFPQLYLASLVDLSDQKKTDIQKNVQAAIDRLKDFQTPGGGFTYWPSQDSWISTWGSSYAGHFLLEAKRTGYSVPDSMISDWRRYQKDTSNAWSEQNGQGQLDQAYRLYTLALDGSVDLSSLNRLKEKNLSDQARWRLATAYLLVGQKDVAKNLVAQAGSTIKPYQELSGTFGSELRDKAMILESMALLDMNSQALVLARDIGTELSKDQWLSTQETSYALLALSRVVGILAGNGQMKVSYSFRDSTGAGGARKTVNSTKPIFLENLNVSASATSVSFEVKNEGSTPVFPRLVLGGVPLPGTEKAVSQGLKLKVKYTDGDGNELASLDGIAAGSDVYADVTVQNINFTRKFDQLALTHQTASGFEIINQRLSAAAQDADNSSDDSASPPPAPKKDFDYQDVRDDRVLTYFSLPPLTQKTFRVQLNATYRGKFYLPSIKVEAMYDASINALIPGYWISIGAAAKASK